MAVQHGKLVEKITIFLQVILKILVVDPERCDADPDPNPNFTVKYLKTKIAQICTVSLFLYLKITYINFLIYLFLFYLI